MWAALLLGCNLNGSVGVGVWRQPLLALPKAAAKAVEEVAKDQVGGRLSWEATQGAASLRPGRPLKDP